MALLPAEVDGEDRGWLCAMDTYASCCVPLPSKEVDAVKKRGIRRATEMERKGEILVVDVEVTEGLDDGGEVDGNGGVLANGDLSRVGLPGVDGEARASWAAGRRGHRRGEAGEEEDGAVMAGCGEAWWQPGRGGDRRRREMAEGEGEGWREFVIVVAGEVGVMVVACGGKRPRV
ncbi:hypothetical protein OsI_02988 [Oryza sativa Indica Group]|uniref:Uncharacterized protein n=1 Tax=Oryza sativa subsp. indica TaxID=39946 RepID=A2WSZ8_ORYSI|nr:hypothetical protein OsI_02988 [Oryza sativa Indica Group]